MALHAQSIADWEQGGGSYTSFCFPYVYFSEVP